MPNAAPWRFIIQYGRPIICSNRLQNATQNFFAVLLANRQSTTVDRWLGDLPQRVCSLNEWLELDESDSHQLPLFSGWGVLGRRAGVGWLAAGSALCGPGVGRP